MLEKEIYIELSFSDAQLSDTELQTAISQTLLPQIQGVEGVQDAQLIPIKDAPEGAKGIGGYLLGKLKVLVKGANLKGLMSWVSKNLSSKTIEFYAKKVDRRGQPREIKFIFPASTNKPLITSEKIEEIINDFLEKDEED